MSEVRVRPARPEERRRWEALMAEHHYLGFRQFAGRGLRHVAVWRGHWLALVGWQSGAFKCAPRDRWVGWHRSVQFRRLHLIGNNTRFLVLPEASGIANLASRALGRSLRAITAPTRTRERTRAKTGETGCEVAYGIVSLSAERAGPKQLLDYNRGHWQVENANHYRRDATLGEDASRIRVRHAPANNATLNNIVLAIVFHRGFRYLPEAQQHFMMRRQDAIDAILSSD